LVDLKWLAVHFKDLYFIPTHEPSALFFSEKNKIIIESRRRLEGEIRIFDLIGSVVCKIEVNSARMVISL